MICGDLVEKALVNGDWTREFHYPGRMSTHDLISLIAFDIDTVKLLMSIFVRSLPWLGAISFLTGWFISGYRQERNHWLQRGMSIFTHCGV